MGRLKHYFLPFFVISLLFTQKVYSQIQGNISNSDPQYYLFAAEIATSKDMPEPQQDKGLLDNKHIRIINLGPIINWNGLDYAPTISADGKTLFYVSNRPGSKLTEGGDHSHDFWVAKKNDRLDTIFFTPVNIDTTTNLGDLGVNTRLNEGVASIAADKQTLYFTGCNRPDGLGDCDIYRTVIEGDKWGKPVNLGKNVNSKYWDSQPSISPDNQRLYFASNRPGPNGKDNIDIWYCDWDMDKEEWKPAQNLTALNTKGVDWSPFIAADNQTLFFASDGHVPNLGGKDFYVARLDASTNSWSKPENLGAPINTKEDESFISLPASGDVLYFSSTRRDLPNYQGDYDIFMAFVPSFFRAVNVKITVIDECSGENIPAKVHVKNPITNRIISDSLTTDHTMMDLVISNTDYGNPKDSNKYVTLEITAENVKYGTTLKAQRVDKPKMTEDVEQTKEFAGIIYDTLTLGQRPVLGTQIDEARYIKEIKASKPELANYNGLVMEQVMTWDLYPLLNYVFFDLGSSEFPSRYILFKTPEETSAFTDTTIAGGTLDKYYHLLNIYGFRLRLNPDAKIEIVGCNDSKTQGENKPNLSKDRAQIVYNYLRDIWKVDESRMKLTSRNAPQIVSNLKDSLGIVENRRVEILCPDWNVMKPVFEKDPKTSPWPEFMNFTMKNGIEDMLVVKRRIEIQRGNKPWKVLTDIGQIDPLKQWDWKSMEDEYPKDEVPYRAILYITTKSGRECQSDPITIPVMQVSLEKKRVETTADSTAERYSLILFPFDRSDAGPLNERIMKDYVYDRVKPTSKVEVIGHTDVVGLYEHNQALSDRRSATVYNGIMKKTSGKFGGMSKRGVGEDEPLYNNNLPEERFYNRTVQVLIHTPVSEYQK